MFTQTEILINYNYEGDKGERGIKMIARMFENRVMSIAQYIKMNKSENNILDFVYQQDLQEIIRLSQQLLDLYQIGYDNTTRPRVLSKFFVKQIYQHKKKGTHQN